MKNKNGKPLKNHVDYAIVTAIKLQKNISYETTSPINQILTNFGRLLQKHNYNIIVFYYTNRNISELTSRIMKRGENLYTLESNPYYRAFPLHLLTNVFNNLDENLKDYIIPMHELGVIHNIVYIS